MVPDVWINVSFVYGYNIYKALHIREKKIIMCIFLYFTLFLKHGRYEIKTVKDELKLTIKEYKGIAYYIDLERGDVYSSEDVKKKCAVPRIVGKYKDGEVQIKKSQ